MDSIPLILDDQLEVFILHLFNIKLLPQSTAFYLKILHLLLHIILILLELSTHPLKAFFVALSVHVHCFIIVYLYFHLVSVFLDLAHSFVS